MTSDGDNLILTNESLEAIIRQFTGRLSIYSRANRRQILGHFTGPDNFTRVKKGILENHI